MTAVHYIINCLEKTPVILDHLLNQIPQEQYKLRRVEDKWSIHEQVCHLVDAQTILIERFIKFNREDNPLITSHEPTFERLGDHYLKMNMEKQLSQFPLIRQEMIDMLNGFDNQYWDKMGRHEAFNPYSTRILLGHTLNVDYSHLFSIEQLGLTKPGLESDIMTFL